MEFFNGRTDFTLLHVEDDPVARGLVAKILPLKFPGMKLLKAENGKVGLEIFREQSPDVILTDIKMPKMDGLTMATEIKALHPKTPIVVVSAHGDFPQYKLMAKEIGIAYCMVKPFDFYKLFSAIEMCISGNWSCPEITMNSKIVTAEN